LLDLLWQLIKDAQILFISESNQFVVLKPEIEMSFDGLLQFFLDWLVTVKILKSSKESVQVVTVIQVFIELLKLI